MTDAMLTAWIGVGGTVVVAISSAFMQWRTTRDVIRAEHLRTENQIAAEARARRDEARHDKLVEALGEVLATSDPDLDMDYGRVVRLIHRLHLLLDARKGTPEGRLAEALNNLGLKVREFIAVRHEVAESRRGETQDLLRAHAEVTDAALPVLHPLEAPAVPPADAERLSFPRF